MAVAAVVLSVLVIDLGVTATDSFMRVSVVSHSVRYSPINNSVDL